MARPLGVFTPFNSLSAPRQELVRLAWQGASVSAQKHLCFQSDFPVGCAILAQNDAAQTKVVAGCNVENQYLPATICAERNAVTTCCALGFTRLLEAAVVCAKFPGGSPCGLCRQVLVQFGQDATILSIVDHDSNVQLFPAVDLLPAAKGQSRPFTALDEQLKKQVKKLQRLATRSHVPYSKSPRGALFVATNGNGRVRSFAGVSDDNASFGGSALAECVAMRTARTAGYDRDVCLLVTVSDPAAANPIDGECLQVLREFGADAPVLLVAPDGSIVNSSLDELLPDSFGPESL